MFVCYKCQAKSSTRQKYNNHIENCGFLVAPKVEQISYKNIISYTDQGCLICKKSFKGIAFGDFLFHYKTSHPEDFHRYVEMDSRWQREWRWDLRNAELRSL